MRAAGTTHGGGKSDDAVDDAATRNPHTIRNRREKARASMNQSTNGVRDAACPLSTRGSAASGTSGTPRASSGRAESRSSAFCTWAEAEIEFQNIVGFQKPC